MTPYYKLSGGGNDFLALAEPELDPPPEQIAAWCTRGLSAGADGLFVLRRLGEDGIGMRYFNADGRSAELCLNGTRCAARLAHELGWTDGPMTVETGAGAFLARPVGAHEVEVELPASTAEPKHLRLDHQDTVWDCWSLDVGVPHLVIFWDRPMADAPLDSSVAWRPRRWRVEPECWRPSQWESSIGAPSFRSRP